MNSKRGEFVFETELPKISIVEPTKYSRPEFTREIVGSPLPVYIIRLILGNFHAIFGHFLAILTLNKKEKILKKFIKYWTQASWVTVL